MCVVVKRKLQLYFWKKNEFLQLVDDINLAEIPRAISWCEETICVGFRGEYSLFEVNNTKKTNNKSVLYRIFLYSWMGNKYNFSRLVAVNQANLALLKWEMRFHWAGKRKRF